MTASTSSVSRQRVHPVDEVNAMTEQRFTEVSDHVALSNLDENDHNDVVQLAGAYREHFDRVLRNGWSRMDNSPAAEGAFALIEVAKIANYRFGDLVADANPIAAARFSRLNELQ